MFRFRVGDKADHLRRDDRLTAPRVAFRGVGDLAGESGRSWCQQGFPPSTDRKAAKKAALAQTRAETEQSIQQGQKPKRDRER